jgi:glycosyltransferase involved in cell wall biosynthesis
MQRVKVAVVIPVHNGGKTLGATLNDLLAQTFTDFTITIIENASTDDTVEIAQKYCAADSRVSIDFSYDLLPVIDNFSRAMRNAASRGTYFMLRACDDTAEPDYLEKLVAALDAQPQCQMAAGITKLVGGAQSERIKRPSDMVVGFGRRYLAGEIPRNLNFPAEWIYGLFRSEAETRLRTRWNELGTAWCAASYTVFDFVVHDEVAYVPDAVFIFVTGSGSHETYRARGFREQLRRRLDYGLGCFALRHSLPPVGALTTVRFFFMCWADSRRKTGYKLLGFL